MSYQHLFYIVFGIGFVILVGTTVFFFPMKSNHVPAAVDLGAPYPNFNLLDRNPTQQEYGIRPTPQF